MRFIPLLVLVPAVAFASPPEAELTESLATVQEAADQVRWLSHEAAAQPLRLQCLSEQELLVGGLEHAGRVARRQFLLAASAGNEAAVQSALQRGAAAAELAQAVAADARACNLIEGTTDGVTSLTVVTRSPERRDRFGAPGEAATRPPNAR